MSNYAEYIAGSMSGVIRIGVGYPIETLKVRIQTIYGDKSILSNTQKIYRTEGIRGFYRGSFGLFIGSSILTSIEFGTYSKVSKYIGTNSNTTNFIGGTLAGFVQSPLTIPIEHIRNRMQVTSLMGEKYKNSYDAYKKIYMNYGLKGIYKGSILTIIRDTPSTGLYFMSYRMTENRLQYMDKNNRLKSIAPGISGVVAGLAFWIPIYPIDVIKNRIQTDGFNKSAMKYNGMFDCAKQLYKSDGILGFYRGFNACLLRSIPVHFAMFLCYENIMIYLS